MMTKDSNEDYELGLVQLDDGALFLATQQDGKLLVMAVHKGIKNTSLSSFFQAQPFYHFMKRACALPLSTQQQYTIQNDLSLVAIVL